MDKELPTSGSGRSAFTVFGFGNSDRYTNFDSPLESGENVESFNATNSIAFPSRPTLKSKKHHPILDNVGDAYKMRLTADKSQLVLQSLLPSGSASAGMNQGEGFPDSQSMGVNGGLEKPVGRRYSDAQSGRAGDAAEVRDSHTDHLLQMFSSTVHSSHSKVLGQGELAPVTETGGEQRALSNTGGLRRQGSSPVLSSMAHQQSSIMQGFLKRGASSSALYTLSESDASNCVVPVTQNSVSLSNTDTHSTATGALQKAEATLAPQVTTPTPVGSNIDSLDASGTKSKGFGILSRTRQFGAWLGKVTHGEKVEVSKKDLNAFAPTSF